MIQVIFFDAMGTLLHLPQPVGEHYAAVARRYGFDLPGGDLQSAFRRAWAASPPRPAFAGPRPDDDKGWWRALVDRVLDETLPPGIKADFPRNAYFEAVYDHFALPGVWTLFPEVRAVLTALRTEGYRLGVISNFDLRLETILRHLDIRDCFESVVVSSQAGADKPDPQIFRTALAAMQVGAPAAVLAGDDRTCDGGAEELGMRVFHVDRPRVTLTGLPAWLGSGSGGN